MSTNSEFPLYLLNEKSVPANWLVDGGEIGDLIHSMDWSATPLSAVLE